MLRRKKIDSANKFSLRCEKGVALLEFGVVLPLLMLILLGVISVVDYVRVTRKLERAVAATADVIAQLLPTDGVNTSVNTILGSIPLMMQPYPIPCPLIWDSL